MLKSVLILSNEQFSLLTFYSNAINMKCIECTKATISPLVWSAERHDADANASLDDFDSAVTLTV